VIIFVDDRRSNGKPMKPIAIIQHVALDGPEYFLDYLNRSRHPLTHFQGL
jgi:hypothetical protein